MLERWSQVGGPVGHGLLRSYGTPVSYLGQVSPRTHLNSRGGNLVSTYLLCTDLLEYLFTEYMIVK